ncbi:IclR family transcriptional regulator [Achromobacter aloeverae]
MQDRDSRFATTLAHGLDVAEAYANGPQVLSNGELARRTGLSKATITRMTTTLATRGLVEQLSGGRGHRLGTATLTLGYPLLAQLRLRRLARLPMKHLAESLRASVSLGVRDRFRMVYVETLRSNDPVRFQPDVGAPLPMLKTAMGRAWLASAHARERAAVRAGLRAAEAVSAQRVSEIVHRAGEQLATHGFCWSEGDWLPDVHAVAVPLSIDVLGERMVLNCGMAARRLGPADLCRVVGPRLLALAARIEADWSEANESPDEPLSLAGEAVPFAWRENQYQSKWLTDPRDGTFARTLALGIDVLQCFGPNDAYIGTRELARRTGALPSTITRITYTLCERGYLRRDAATGRYRLGAATLALAYPMLSSLRVRRIARPHMLALSEKLGVAVSLGRRHGTSMVYVETAWRTDARFLPPDTGAPMPMLLTAMGRAWIASAGEGERNDVLRRIGLEQPQAYARYARAALQSAQACKQQGWCSSNDFRPEIVAVAVPLAVPVDGVSYVLNCGMLKERCSTQAQTKAIATALRGIAALIQKELVGE